MNNTPWLNSPRMKKFRLLVIDDLRENIALFTNILKDEYDITIATSATLGLELAKREPKIDLVLLDIVMPDMDGYEVCRLLKANAFTEDIPVIFLTVLDETADIEKGFLAGGVDYVTKPFEPSILKARVKTHCELSSQKKELKRFNQSLEMVVIERTRELEQAQLHMERLARQAALGDVIAMIAHQWKQPISIISMIVNGILLDIELSQLKEEALQKELGNITVQTEYLSQTIDNFRNFFKPDQEKQTIHIKEFFDSLKDLMKTILKYYVVNLEIEINGVDTLHVYKNELLQVIVNLINNAKDAIVANRCTNGRIHIRVFAVENSVKLEVCDNGGGISLDVIDKLGEAYVSTKSRQEGTGLGLYMSKMITQKHLRGTLEWYNKDDGACFSLTIPQ